MLKYEYQLVPFHPTTTWVAGTRLKMIYDILAEEGQNGWRLVAFLSSDQLGVKNEGYLLFMVMIRESAGADSDKKNGLILDKEPRSWVLDKVTGSWILGVDPGVPGADETIQQIITGED